MNNEYDIVIIGGGVSGTALLYVLSMYTNVKRIALVEKYDKLAQVNSKHTNNSQTLHFGDIETNYTVEKAAKVSKAANLVKKYVETIGKKEPLYKKYHKMVLAVGEEEVVQLEKRYTEFKKLFPELKKVGRKELEKIEPKIVEGRDSSQALLALFSPNGYTINYGKLSESFVKHAKKTNKHIDVFLGKKVLQITKKKKGHDVQLKNKTLHAPAVAVTAGAHSLLFAKQLGYGLNYSVLPVSGRFYFAPQVLNGKVYTLQKPKLPFAAIHGDPDVMGPEKTRFGPIAKAMPLLERYNWWTFFDYLKTADFDLKTILSVFRITFDPILFKYMLKETIYELPLVGKYFYVKSVQKIIPTMRARDLMFANGIGGIRPQVVNKDTKWLQMGTAKLTGDNILFNITPSPGASICLKNAEDDAKKLLEFLGKSFAFDEKRFKQDFT